VLVHECSAIVLQFNLNRKRSFFQKFEEMYIRTGSFVQIGDCSPALWPSTDPHCTPGVAIIQASEQPEGSWIEVR